MKTLLVEIKYWRKLAHKIAFYAAHLEDCSLRYEQLCDCGLDKWRRELALASGEVYE
jgi:hypothetical protein